MDDEPRLIPGLPDEISHQILARIPRTYYLNIKAVSRRWKAQVTSPEIYNIRKLLGTTEEWLYILMNEGDDELFWYALDPVSKRWQRLPPIPNARVGSTIGRNDSSDQIMHSSCAIAAVEGCLYMLGGFSRLYSLSRVWKYDPVSNSWSEANPMFFGRACCKTGVLNNKLFVVGGVSLDLGAFGGYVLTPLQSAEVFDPKTGLWLDIPSMPCSKAKALASEVYSYSGKPVATGLASYRGKLYVPQSLYRLPFIHDAGGEVYDPETNSWVDMPTGMGEGWPAKQSVTKSSVIVDGDLYALDLSGSVESAKIKVYNHHDDSWSEGDVPIHQIAESYDKIILTGLLRKLHVVAKDDNGDIAVLRADKREDLIASSSEGELLLLSLPLEALALFFSDTNFGILEDQQLHGPRSHQIKNVNTSFGQPVTLKWRAKGRIWKEKLLKAGYDCLLPIAVNFRYESRHDSAGVHRNCDKLCSSSLHNGGCYSKLPSPVTTTLKRRSKTFNEEPITPSRVNTRINLRLEDMLLAYAYGCPTIHFVATAITKQNQLTMPNF